MYYYAPDENKKGKRAALAASMCYLVVFLAVCFLVSFRMDYVPQSEGILVDFGTDSEGKGEEAVTLSQEQQPSSSEASASEKYMTQEIEEAPALSDASEQRDSRVTDTESRNQANNTTHSFDVETREVNRRALFPGRSTLSDAASQGSAPNADGNAGNEAGGDGSKTGTGIGTEGISFDLQGRRPVGSLPRPGYEANAQGIVIVEITVDASGKVQTASFRPHGSTTQDSRLLEAALKAARAAKFTPSESNVLQTGSITYVFRLQ